ncbi:MAG: 3-dehydroquinate synthase, partial [Armatimonadota bacterium]
MERVRVDLGDRSYPIIIGPGLLDQAGEILPEFCIRKAFVVTDTRVDKLHGAKIRGALSQAGIDASFAVIPPGEKQKSLKRLGTLAAQMLAQGFDRSSTVIAFGGGVIGDLAGFLAAVFMRGINYVQVPTTLLACVDSSIGGKTAVNLPQSKNCIGAFHQPILVLEDIDLLRTLSKRDLRAGAVELIKHGFILDPDLYSRLFSGFKRLLQLEPGFTSQALRRSCKIKARVVSADERESGYRAILNFGHTVGHALESTAGYGVYRHGEAVAIGMLAEAMLSERTGFAQEPVWQSLNTLFSRMRLPTHIPKKISIQKLIDTMYTDKKNRDGNLTVVLPRRIGFVEPVTMRGVA